MTEQRKCDTCGGAGWLEAEGRLGLEIQHCQTCGECKSDKEAYALAGRAIDTSKHFADIF